ncbi:MAG: MaoC family dehydratase [Proteobacteria bacterium]|nr:MaoC family dehydratase [Pseudomonadota bacterium]
MYIDEIVVGQTASLERTVTQEVINSFADASGDRNPVHVDTVFAAGTMFKGTIAHGMLSAAYISAVLGTQLPGPGAIYMAQSLKFRAPVRPGDKVFTTCTVKEVIPEKKRVVLDTFCKVGDTVVLEGEATMMVQPRPKQS